MIKLAKTIITAPEDIAPEPATRPTTADSGSTRATPTEPTPALIVFGPDKDGKPHASWFAEQDAALATKAAGVMGMRILQLADEAGIALAAKLPQGRVFASGRAFVPFAAKGVYARLSALAGPPTVDDAPTKGTTAVHTPSEANGKASEQERVPETDDGRYPRSWAGVTVGSLVLISEGEQDGWYEAEVVEAKAGGIYILRWRDWPDLPLLVRRREHMALLHPNTAAAAAA